MIAKKILVAVSALMMLMACGSNSSVEMTRRIDIFTGCRHRPEFR